MDEDEAIVSDWEEVVENIHEMNLNDELLRGIYEYGFEKPTAIQQRAISQCIKGHDVIVQAQSGTGKITAVLISILQQINTSLNKCQALIMVPSFEIAHQIQNVLNVLGKFMKAECCACTGLKNVYDYVRELNTFPHVVVGTPSCVHDLINKCLLRSKFINIFVLVEPNLLFYRGSKVQIVKVFKSLEENTQVILLSSQMYKKALDESTQFVSNPALIIMQKEELTLEAFKQFYINNSQKIETLNGRSSKSINYVLYSEPPKMDVGGTIDSDWNVVVDNFHDMNLKEELLRGIYQYGFEKPSSTQLRIFLSCIMGHDIIVQTQSGVGKTTAVVISILQQIDTSLNECQALILVPSVELARQIQKVVIDLGKFINADCHACIGIEQYCGYIQEPYTVSHIVVGTPACVSDLICRKSLRTQFIETFMLEEPNKLLSGSINIHIEKIIGSLDKGTQVILLSNQMSEKSFYESSYFMSNPVHIFMQKDVLTLDSNLEGIKHFFVNFTMEECKFDSLCNLFDTLSITQVVIFCNTCYKVECLTESMRLKRFNVSAMHREMDR
ncbi:eukaryotic initiation factor 4A-I-like, partial [Myzus persicae]